MMSESCSKGIDLTLHLAPDRIGRLDPAGNPGVDAVIPQHLLQLGLDLAGQVLVGALQELEARLNRAVGIRVHFREGQVFQLVLEALHPDALGQRRVDVHGFARDPAPLVGRFDGPQGLHVVQPVGELDQQDPDILRHGDDQLAEVLRVLGLFGLQLEPGELGDAIDQARDLAAEQPVDIFQGGIGVLDRVVEQGRDDRLMVELELGQDARDFDRMGEIGIARGPGLAAVDLHGIDVRAVQCLFIGPGIVRLDPLDELKLAHHFKSVHPLACVSPARSDDTQAGADRQALH